MCPEICLTRVLFSPVKLTVNVNYHSMLHTFLIVVSKDMPIINLHVCIYGTYIKYIYGMYFTVFLFYILLMLSRVSIIRLFRKSMQEDI